MKIIIKLPGNKGQEDWPRQMTLKLLLPIQFLISMYFLVICLYKWVVVIVLTLMKKYMLLIWSSLSNSLYLITKKALLKMPLVLISMWLRIDTWLWSVPPLTIILVLTTLKDNSWSVVQTTLQPLLSWKKSSWKYQRIIMTDQDSIWLAPTMTNSKKLTPQNWWS